MTIKEQRATINAVNAIFVSIESPLPIIEVTVMMHVKLALKVQ